MGSIKISIVKNDKVSMFKRGNIVYHARFGEGIVVGFSNISGEPFVFFYDVEGTPQCIGVFSESLIS